MENKKEEIIYCARIGEKEIKSTTYKELIYNCLQMIYNSYKDLPAEERIKAYVKYFVDTFSYDWNLAKDTLSKNRVETSEVNEKELAELFIKKAGVCNQFAKALSLLSCFDDEIDIYYCFCRVLPNGEQEDVGHAINTCIINNKASIIDISSMVHAKENFYKQDKSVFAFVDFKTYISNLQNENVLYRDIIKDEYILGNIKYLKKFEFNYLILSLTAEDINKNKWSNNFWKVPVEKENNVNI